MVDLICLVSAPWEVDVPMHRISGKSYVDCLMLEKKN